MTSMAYYEVKGGPLYKVQRGQKASMERCQVVVPSPFHWQIWWLVHNPPLGGYLGHSKTRARIVHDFFWPWLQDNVDVACPKCQRGQEQRQQKSPLQPMLVIETPFSQVTLDIVGPLLGSQIGHQYVLVLVDYATQFLEAVPLRSIMVTWVTEELLKWIVHIGIPHEIVTNQRTNFFLGVMKVLCNTPGITHLKMSVYHSQTKGLVERLKGTIKRILQR